MKKIKKIIIFSLATFGALSVFADSGKEVEKLLEKESRLDYNGFFSPSNDYKPWVYWYWLNGNISKESIKKDVEVFVKNGIGGAGIFNLGQDWTGQPDGGVYYLTAEWLEMLKYALSELSKHNLKAMIHNCDGFQEAGGVHIKPEHSMKLTTYNAVNVRKGMKQINVPRPSAKLDYYEDALCVAFPAPETVSEKPAMFGSLKSVTQSESVPVSTGNLKLEGPNQYENIKENRVEDIMDGNPQTGAVVASPSDDSESFIMFEFKEGFECSKIYFLPSMFKNYTPDISKLQKSDDGKLWEDITDFTFDTNMGGMDGFIEQKFPPVLKSFPPVKARFFRALFVKARSQAIIVPELLLLKNHESPPYYPNIKWLGQKMGIEERFDVCMDERTETENPSATLRSEDVVDLTGRLSPDGSVDWTVPDNRTWTIMRLGFTTTASTNHPAQKSSHGLECDKMSKEALKFHFDNGLGKILEYCGEYVGTTILGSHADSWECKFQNWTGGFEKDFKRLRGYDIVKFIPVFMGLIVDNVDASETFLADFRKTCTEMISENYYAEFNRLCNEKGLYFSAEAMGPGQNGGGKFYPPCDQILFKSVTDVPMGEFHEFRKSDRSVHIDDMCKDNREASSAAHVYGKKLAAAEAFTGPDPFLVDPRYLKNTNDFAFTTGINWLIYHCTALQPDDHEPGWQFQVWGPNFQRNNDWWSESVGWNTYNARCQYLLRKGDCVADILLFYGEEAPAFAKRNKLPALFENDLANIGWYYDWCDQKALMSTEFKDGKIMTTGGKYKILVLPENWTCSGNTLKKIESLIEAGAVVCGGMPKNTATLTDDRNEMSRRIEALWASAEGGKKIGKGRLYAHRDLEKIIANEQLIADMDINVGKDANIKFIHRKTDNADIYFVANLEDKKESVALKFRDTRAHRTVWDAVTGEIFNMSSPDSVQHDFDRKASAFFVFSDEIIPVAKNIKNTSGVTEKINAEWNLNFVNGRKAPENVKLNDIKALNEFDEFDIKHYSGTVSYTTNFHFDHTLTDNSELFIDFTQIGGIAKIYINDRYAGSLWTFPYELNVTGFVTGGKNDIRIDVTNCWKNRLIGDQELSVEERVGKTPYFNPYEKDTAKKKFPAWTYAENFDLMPSGLLYTPELLIKRQEPGI